MRAQRRVVRRGRPRAPASRPSRSGRPPGLPAVYAEWPSDDAGRARPCWSTATTTCSRSTRSSCGTPTRSTRPSTATCCAPAAPPTTRASCCSTCSACAPTWPPPAATRPAVTLKFLIEGEEESGSPNFEALLAERRDRLDCDVVVDHRHRHDRRRTCRARSPACAGWSCAPSTSTAPTSTCTPASSAARCPTRPPRSPGWSAALHDDDGRVQVPGFYDDVARADRRRAGAVRPGARTTRPSSSTSPSRGRWPARRASPPSSGSAPGRPPRSTASAAATRAPAARRSCRATPSSSSPSGSSPTQDPRKIRAAVEQFVADAHPGRHRARRSTGRATASRPAWCRSTPRPTGALTDAISDGVRRRCRCCPPARAAAVRRPRSQQVARRAAGVPRRRPARRPDPRAEREGHPVDALPRAPRPPRCCGPSFAELGRDGLAADAGP